MATRDYQFINGPETATLPTVTTPTADEDIITKGFADDSYAPLASATPLAANRVVQTDSSGDLTDAGNATLQGNLTVSGDLTVQGTNTVLNTTSLDVEDINITLNVGGNNATAEGAGLTVFRTGADGSIVYEDALASKWKVGLVGSEVELANVSSTQTLTNKTLAAGSNTISATASKAAQFSAGNALEASSVTTTELGYVSGVTSAIQTQLTSNAGAISSHTSASSGVHGVTGSVVGTSDAQALTNKTVATASNTISATASKAAQFSAGNALEASAVSTTELGYVAGVSSAIQTQIDSKASSASLTSHTGASTGVHGVTGSVVGTSDSQALTNKTIAVASNNITSSTGVVARFNVSTGNLEPSSTSNTELGYVAGVTSAIQTQLDAKIAKSFLDAKGDLITASADNTPYLLPVGTNGQYLSANSAVTGGLEWSTIASATPPDQSYELSNLALSVTASAGTITIALKTKAGSDPSGGSPVYIGFRDVTVTSGVYNQRSVTAALSMTLAGATTLGVSNNVNTYIYVYAFDNAGTITLGASQVAMDEGTVQSSSTSTTSNSVIYQSAALSSKPIRLIGRFISFNNASSWGSPTEVSVKPFEPISITAKYYLSNGTSIPSGSPALIKFTNKVYDPLNAYGTGTGFFTVPLAGKYSVKARILMTWTLGTGSAQAIGVAVNGTIRGIYYTRAWAANTDSALDISDEFDCVAGDTLAIWTYSNATSTTSEDFGSGETCAIFTWIGI